MLAKTGMVTEHLRIYDRLIEHHLKEYRQMVFVSGPRQVGKTTTCRRNGNLYLSWDILENQRKILKGPETLAQALKLDEVHAQAPVVVLDELHKYPKWKNFLKGLFDAYGEKAKIIVTGSSRLDIYRKGGDSLMGRYFLYRMHPFSVAEIASTTLTDKAISSAKEIDEGEWQALWTHGGFPEPFLKRNQAFTRRWRAFRRQQLTKEDMREVTQVQELGAMEVLIQILGERSSQQVVYTNLAQEVNVAVDTIRRWLLLLENMHYGFLVRPWFKSVANSLRKEPKWFLRDWSEISDVGRRAETFVGCHLLKAVEGWTDRGLGDFSLHYLRTKQKKEVDFLVVRDGAPWFLVEVKNSDRSLSPNLRFFHEQLKTAHAFQVVIDLPFEAVDCFKENRPVVVPARSFLSQLL